MPPRRGLFLQTRWRALFLVALASLELGCAGSRSSIVADDSSYPVSMSPMVYGSAGRLLHRGMLEEVGEFTFEYRSIHMLFTLIPLSRNRHDLSQIIDEQVERAGGEAIVDLSVVAHSNLWISICPVLGFGILPAYSDVTVSGVIVRERHEAPEGAKNVPPIGLFDKSGLSGGPDPPP